MSLGQRPILTASDQPEQPIRPRPLMKRARTNSKPQSNETGDLADAQHRRLEPYLPPGEPRTERLNAPHRRVLNGIL